MLESLAESLLTTRGIVEFKLDSWGIWSTGSLGIGYPSMDMAANMVGRGIQIAPLTDDEGLLIDRTICKLKHSQPEAFYVATQYYQRRLQPTQMRLDYARAIQMLDIVRAEVTRVLFPGIDGGPGTD